MTLKKYFDHSIAHFWSATQSHIYLALEKLEQDGFVSSQLVLQAGSPNRKEYQITERGRSELHRWLTSPLPFVQAREGWLIQVFFSQSSTNDEIAALLQARRQIIRQKLEEYRSSVQAAVDQNAERVGVDRARELWQITLDHGIDFYEFELAWLEKTLQPRSGAAASNLTEDRPV